MNILINKEKNFGFLWSETEVGGDWKYGFIQVIIGNEIYPNNRIEYNYSLQTVFSNFKSSFYEKYFPGGKTDDEFGEREFDIDLWNNLELGDVFVIETTEMGGTVEQQLSLCIGYSGDTERLFYSFDNEKTFKEIRYPKGTVESIISLLPDYSIEKNE